jgi:putative MATE family efflux protein
VHPEIQSVLQVGTSYKEIWKIALPIILGNLVQSILTITNTAFLGRVGEITLGASAIGGVFYFLVNTIAMGLAIGPQIIIARRTGEGNYLQIGKVFSQSVYIMLPLSVFLFLVLRLLAPLFFSSVLQSDAIVNEADRYLSIMSFAVFFSVLNTNYRALFIGLAKTRILTYSIIIMVGVNIFFDYSLIFGKFGFPEMGIQGAALSSIIAEGSAFIYFGIYTRFFLDIKKYNLFRFGKWSNTETRNILQLSYPSIFQYLISIGSWFMFFVIIEQTGELPIAISNIVRSIMMLIMMPIWGLATTGNTMVSNIIGQEKKEEVLVLIRRIINLGFIITIIYLPVILFIPEWVIRIYTNDAKLIAGAIKPLYVVYVASVFCVPGAISLFSLSGTGDTKTSFLIEVATTSTYLVYAVLVALVFKLSLEVVWGAETLYWIMITILAYLRIKSGKWKKIKV